MKKALLISLAMISLIDLSSVALAGNSDFTLLKSEVLEYVAQQLDVPAEKIQIDYLRLPKVSTQNVTKISVFSQNGSKKVGHLILWATYFKGSKKVGKFPLTISAGVEIPVVVSVQRLSRKTLLNTTNIELQPRLINKHFDRHFYSLDQLTGFETRQAIAEGMNITSAMVRPRPLLHKGDQVNIEVKAGNLVVSTPGVAREDGQNGEKIKVLCKKTRKNVYAIVASPTTVKVASGGIR